MHANFVWQIYKYTLVELLKVFKTKDDMVSLNGKIADKNTVHMVLLSAYFGTADVIQQNLWQLFCAMEKRN